MEFIKKAVKVGNSAGVILPKKFLGSEVKITILRKPINIKKEALKILDPYLQEIIGVFIMNEKPIEILAVSSKIKKLIYKDNMKISIVPFGVIKRDFLKNERLREKLLNAKTIFNKSILIELKKLKQ